MKQGNYGKTQESIDREMARQRFEMDKCHAFALIVEEAYTMFGPLKPHEIDYIKANPDAFGED